jgi:hypothetical protein
MATLVEPGTDRLRAEAAELAKHYGVTIAVCPPRRAQRKGVVEAAIRYVGRTGWCTARVVDPAEAQRSLDRWCVEVADQRRRGALIVAQEAAAEPLLALPPTAYPAELLMERVVSSSALVSFEGNCYSVPPTLAGQTVTVRVRVGERSCKSSPPPVSWSQATAKWQPVPASSSVSPCTRQRWSGRCSPLSPRGRACARKPNRPPTAEALAIAAAHAAVDDVEIPSLAEYARLAAAS